MSKINTPLIIPSIMPSCCDAHFSTFGLNENASLAEIDRAYCRLALTVQFANDDESNPPSSTIVSTSQFQAISIAYHAIIAHKHQDISSTYDCGNNYISTKEDKTPDHDYITYEGVIREMLNALMNSSRFGKVDELDESCCTTCADHSISCCSTTTESSSCLVDEATLQVPSSSESSSSSSSESSSSSSSSESSSSSSSESSSSSSSSSSSKTSETSTVLAATVSSPSFPFLSSANNVPRYDEFDDDEVDDYSANSVQTFSSAPIQKQEKDIELPDTQFAAGEERLYKSSSSDVASPKKDFEVAENDTKHSRSMSNNLYSSKLCLDSISCNSITLHWSKLKHKSDDIEYALEMRAENNLTGPEFILVFIGTACWYTIPNLLSGIHYTFRVRAHNGTNKGDWSDLATFTTDGKRSNSTVLQHPPVLSNVALKTIQKDSIDHARAQRKRDKARLRKEKKRIDSNRDHIVRSIECNTTLAKTSEVDTSAERALRLQERIEYERTLQERAEVLNNERIEEERRMLQQFKRDKEQKEMLRQHSHSPLPEQRMRPMSGQSPATIHIAKKDFQQTNTSTSSKSKSLVNSSHDTVASSAHTNAISENVKNLSAPKKNVSRSILPAASRWASPAFRLQQQQQMICPSESSITKSKAPSPSASVCSQTSSLLHPTMVSSASNYSFPVASSSSNAPQTSSIAHSFLDQPLSASLHENESSLRTPLIIPTCQKSLQSSALYKSISAPSSPTLLTSSTIPKTSSSSNYRHQSLPDTSITFPISPNLVKDNKKHINQFSSVHNGIRKPHFISPLMQQYLPSSSSTLKRSNATRLLSPITDDECVSESDKFHALSSAPTACQPPTSSSTTLLMSNGSTSRLRTEVGPTLAQSKESVAATDTNENLHSLPFETMTSSSSVCALHHLTHRAALTNSCASRYPIHSALTGNNFEQDNVWRVNEHDKFAYDLNSSICDDSMPSWIGKLLDDSPCDNS